MPELSIAILVHNEAALLEGAIRSVLWADQIVVVDAESTDGTSEIARRLGADVIFKPNVANLNINKNVAIRACKSEWVLVLDADERISDALAGEIRRVMADNRAEGFLIPRRNYVLGKWVRWGSQYPDWQLRLFKRDRGRFAEKHVHERISIQGVEGRLSEPMDHHPYPDIASLIQKRKFYAAFEAGLLYERGRRIGFCGLIVHGVGGAALRFFRRYVLRLGFLDGVPGLIIHTFDAWNVLLRWFYLWEKLHAAPIDAQERS